MKTFSGTLILCCLCAQGFRFLDDHHTKGEPEKKSDAPPEKKSEAAPAKSSDAPPEKSSDAAPAKSSDAPLDGPAHSDNLQDEMVDQADPEFDMISGGDGCIDWDDAKKPLLDQFQEGAPDRSTMTQEQLAEEDAIKADMMADHRMMFDYADGLDSPDGCITKAEFKKAGEMEGPPPGFTKEKMNQNPIKDSAKAEAEVARQLAEQDRMEFDMMDRNGDGKISKSEAYHYANENMDQADVDQKLLEQMFNDSDKNGDGFITYPEFTGAGEAIEGDGNEMEKAPPMDTSHPQSASDVAPSDVAPAPMAFKIIKARKASLRARVTKKLLAHKPAFKVTAHLLNMDKRTRTH